MFLKFNLCCGGTLLAHGQLAVHQDPQGLSAKLLSTQLVLAIWVHGVLSQGQDFVFPFVDLHKVISGSFLQLAEIPLNGSIPTWFIIHFCQFSIICKTTLLRKTTLYNPHKSSLLARITLATRWLQIFLPLMVTNLILVSKQNISWALYAPYFFKCTHIYFTFSISSC